MALLGFLIGALLPRVLVAYYWLATNLVDRAFDTVIFPLIGIIILPWTTLAYILVYSPIADGVIGVNWVWVVLGFFVDVLTYSASGYRTTHRGVHA